jgi:hypothetical protein
LLNIGHLVLANALDAQAKPKGPKGKCAGIFIFHYYANFDLRAWLGRSCAVVVATARVKSSAAFAVQVAAALTRHAHG